MDAMQDTHHSFSIAVASLKAHDPTAACEYVRTKADVAVEIVCQFPGLRQIIENLGAELRQMSLNLDGRLTSLDGRLTSLSDRVASLEERQRAEGGALVKIIHLISPSFSEEDRAVFDHIVTEMERPLHDSGRRPQVQA